MQFDTDLQSKTMDLFCAFWHVAPLSKILLCSSLEITILFLSRCFIATSWLRSEIFLLPSLKMFCFSCTLLLYYIWQHFYINDRKDFCMASILRWGLLCCKCFTRSRRLAISDCQTNLPNSYSWSGCLPCWMS